MPSTPSPSSVLNPSQAVERIREIIVGRHLEKLEDRVVKLESREIKQEDHFEDRLCFNEARVEAIQHALEHLSDTSRVRAIAQEEGLIPHGEVQRLAAQIHQSVANQSSGAIQQAEQRISSWFANWQVSLQQHLTDRDSHLKRQLFQELATLREQMETQIRQLQTRTIDRDRIEERFRSIANAAHVLAQCASPIATSGQDFALPR